MGMREKLIEMVFKSLCDHAHKSCKLSENIADDIIDNGVTIPARCKNCVFWSDGIPGCTDHVKICTIGFYMIGENGYCSFGEEKKK